MNEGVTDGGTTGPEETVAVPIDFRVVLDSTVVSGGVTELVAASRESVEHADRLAIATRATTAVNRVVKTLDFDVILTHPRQSSRRERSAVAEEGRVFIDNRCSAAKPQDQHRATAQVGFLDNIFPWRNGQCWIFPVEQQRVCFSSRFEVDDFCDQASRNREIDFVFGNGHGNRKFVFATCGRVEDINQLNRGIQIDAGILLELTELQAISVA